MFIQYSRKFKRKSKQDYMTDYDTKTCAFINQLNLVLNLKSLSTFIKSLSFKLRLL